MTTLRDIELQWAETISEGVLLHQSRRRKEAKAKAAEARQFAEKRFGPTHEYTIASDILINTYAVLEGDFSGAMRAFKATRSGADTIMDPGIHDILLCAATVGLAAIQMHEKNYVDAELLLERAQELVMQSDFLSTSDAGGVRLALGELRFVQSSWKQVVPLYEQLVAELDRPDQARHEAENLIEALGRLGLAHYVQRNYTAAEDVFEQMFRPL